ncbi:MAG: DUF484 family protein [Proteobacteria bacterium]|nr:DUF484 family protein [Pseudomonadota bacterium]
MSDATVRDELDPTDVASFLRRHPEFLGEYPDIALTLALPRDQGATTSLAGYQLEALREQKRELNRRLHDLIGIAQENEQLMIRTHSLAMALLRERTLGDSVRRVAAALTEDFNTERVRLVLFRAASEELPAADWLLLAPGGVTELPAFAEFLQRGEPLCGRLQPEKIAYLFGAEKDQVQSAVLIAVGEVGMLAIGSADAHRFHPGMGTVFLKLIAETIAAAIARYS